MSELRNLIDNLKTKINNNDPMIRKIEHPKLLMASLEELDGIIGMKKVKNSVADQTIQLIQYHNSGKKNDSMLNVALYGPPGTGKTEVGVIIAKIMYSIGFLKKNSEDNKSNKDDEFDEMQIINLLVMMSLIMSMFLPFMNFYLNMLTYLYIEYPYVLYIFIFLFLFSIIMTYNYNSNKEKIIADKVSQGEVNSRELISVVSRKDFVAEYLGQTGQKTTSLLEKNRGKVLFIDEAYTLCQFDTFGGDMYGQDALTELNKFMSENPGEIAVIFAGYKDKLEQTIFKAQPGLKSRVKFHFDIDLYDSIELTDILNKQLKEEGYLIEETFQVAEIIDENLEYFKGYGRDTKNLKSFILMQKNKNAFLYGFQPSHVVTPDDVRKGMERFLENKTHKVDEKVRNKKSMKENVVVE